MSLTVTYSKEPLVTPEETRRTPKKKYRPLALVYLQWVVTECCVRVNDTLPVFYHHTGITPDRVYYCVGVLTALYLVFGHFAQLLCNLVGFAYPAYRSFRAIRTSETQDDTHWLIYWTVFAAFSLLDVALEWMPLYWLVKCAFLLYLHLPQFNGAINIYNQWVAPLFTYWEEEVIELLTELETQLSDENVAVQADVDTEEPRSDLTQ